MTAKSRLKKLDFSYDDDGGVWLIDFETMKAFNQNGELSATLIREQEKVWSYRRSKLSHPRVMRKEDSIAIEQLYESWLSEKVPKDCNSAEDPPSPGTGPNVTA